MVQELIRTDDRGVAVIDKDVLMKSAISLVFPNGASSVVDADVVARNLREAHATLLEIASTLLANANAETHVAPVPAQPESSIVIAAEVLEVPKGKPMAVASVPTVEMAAATTANVSQPSLPLDLPPSSKANQLSPKAKRSSPAKPIAEILDLVQSIPSKETLKRRASDRRPLPAEPRLPRRLSSKEDALRMDTIICLEDGVATNDLATHLKTLGITPEAYRKKWGLPKHYPMRAPSLIQKRGIMYEYDPARRMLIRV